MSSSIDFNFQRWIASFSKNLFYDIVCKKTLYCTVHSINKCKKRERRNSILWKWESVVPLFKHELNNSEPFLRFIEKKNQSTFDENYRPFNHFLSSNTDSIFIFSFRYSWVLLALEIDFTLTILRIPQQAIKCAHTVRNEIQKKTYEQNRYKINLYGNISFYNTYDCAKVHTQSP